MTMPLTLVEQVEHVERTNEATRKFVAEQHKLAAERDKLTAEVLKLGRDRRLEPLRVVLAAIAAGAACFAAGATFMRAWGGP